MIEWVESVILMTAVVSILDIRNPQNPTKHQKKMMKDLILKLLVEFGSDAAVLNIPTAFDFMEMVDLVRRTRSKMDPYTKQLPELNLFKNAPKPGN